MTGFKQPNKEAGHVRRFRRKRQRLKKPHGRRFPELFAEKDNAEKEGRTGAARVMRCVLL